MAFSCLGDRKQVQDARFDSRLTGVKKESFYWRTKTIVHNKGFPRKKKHIRHVKKVYSVKTNAGVFWKPDTAYVWKSFSSFLCLFL